MTPRQRERRFSAIKSIGCLASRKRGYYLIPDVHHLNLLGQAGRERRGDEYTIGLSIWHHRGIPLEGTSAKWCRRVLGPSLARESVLFREVFGSDEELLALQNELIEKYTSRLVGARCA